MIDEKILNGIKEYDNKYGKYEKPFEWRKILADELNLANLIINPSVNSDSNKFIKSTEEYHRDNASQIINGDTINIKISAEIRLTDYANYALQKLGKISEEEFQQNYKIAIKNHKPLEDINIMKLYSKEEIAGFLEGDKKDVARQANNMRNTPETKPNKQQFIEGLVSMAQKAEITVNPTEGKEVSVVKLTMKNIQKLLSKLDAKVSAILGIKSGNEISFHEELTRSK